MFPYTWKFLWAPLLDRFSLLGMSRRKGWMVLSQALLIFFIAIIGFLTPKYDIYVISFCSFFIAFLSATYDIAIDAYRREILSDKELGIGNSIFVNAYKLQA